MTEKKTMEQSQRASYRAGMGYARSLPREERYAVDVDRELVSITYMPDGDYTWLRDRGYDPDPRLYWLGYNAACAAYWRKMRYSAVVESGSCSTDYRRWEERAHCGHAHKTIEAAEKCLGKKRRMVCEHGRYAGNSCRHCLGGYARGSNCSALWYNGTIHNQHAERVRS